MISKFDQLKEEIQKKDLLKLDVNDLKINYSTEVSEENGNQIYQETLLFYLNLCNQLDSILDNIIFISEFNVRKFYWDVLEGVYFHQFKSNELGLIRIYAAKIELNLYFSFSVPFEIGNSKTIKTYLDHLHVESLISDEVVYITNEYNKRGFDDLGYFMSMLEIVEEADIFHQMIKHNEDIILIDFVLKFKQKRLG